VDDILGFRQSRPILASVVAVLLVIGASIGVGYWYGTKRNQVKATQAENAANVAKGERDAFKAQAEAKDQEIAAKSAATLADKRALARANAEIQRIKDLPPVVPIGPGTPDLSPVVERQRQLIDAYEVGKQASEKYIFTLEADKLDLTISRDAWKASSEAGAREAAGLRIALEAQKSLTKNALWRGRIQGLAIGLGGGYVYGRAR